MPEKKYSSGQGRPRSVAPVGYVTIKDAANHCQVSDSVVRRHVRQRLVRARVEKNGVSYVVAEDLEKIQRHEAPPDRPRIPVQLSPSPARHQAWALCATVQGITVTELACKLLDRASGFRRAE